MKTYTSFKQSKKLAEILSLQSADMYYFLDPTPAGNIYHLTVKRVDVGIKNLPQYGEGDIPCWSLAALLGVLPKIVNNETLFIATSAALWHISYKNIYTAIDDNLIDACVAMIEKLHELKIL